MVQLSTFEQRIADTLTVFGVPLNTVAIDGINLVPFGTGFQLRWNGGLYLNAPQAAALVAEHTGDTTCPTCYGEREAQPGDLLPIVYCYTPDTEPVTSPD